MDLLPLGRAVSVSRVFWGPVGTPQGPSPRERLRVLEPTGDVMGPVCRLHNALKTQSIAGQDLSVALN